MSLKTSKLAPASWQKQIQNTAVLFAYEGLVTSGRILPVAAQESELFDRYHGNVQKQMFAVKGQVIDREHEFFKALWTQDGRLHDIFAFGANIVAGVNVNIGSLSKGKKATNISGAQLRNLAMKYILKDLKKYDADYASLLNRDRNKPSGTNNPDALCEEVIKIRYNKLLQVKHKNAQVRSSSKAAAGGSSAAALGVGEEVSDADGDGVDEDNEDDDDYDDLTSAPSTRVQPGEADSDDEALADDVVLVASPNGWIPANYVAWRLFAMPSAAPLSCLSIIPSSGKSRATIKKEGAAAADDERSVGYTAGVSGKRGCTVLDKGLAVRAGFLKQEENNTKMRALEAEIMALTSENVAYATIIGTNTTTLNSPYFSEAAKAKAAAQMEATGAKIESNIEAMSVCRSKIRALQVEITVDLTSSDEVPEASLPSSVHIPGADQIKQRKKKKAKITATLPDGGVSASPLGDAASSLSSRAL
jgi:hypothetical protein